MRWLTRLYCLTFGHAWIYSFDFRPGGGEHRMCERCRKEVVG